MAESIRADHLAPARAEVDLACLQRNAHLLQKEVGEARLMAIVKAAAYGHGAVPVTRALVDAGVAYFAVATVPEGIELREAGVRAPILVLASPLEEQLPVYAEYDLDVTISSVNVADDVVRHARAGRRLRAHVKADTGMHRIGMPPSEAADVVHRLAEATNVHVVALWTHLATATEEIDPFAREQLARFRPVWDAVKDLDIHLHIAQTGALLHGLETVAPPERVLMRTGIGLYGYPPSPALNVDIPLEPALRFVSRVTQVKTVDPGEGVSYRCTWRAEGPARIATVAAGYADGIPYALSNCGEVGIAGARYPIAGQVCMDMTMVYLGPPSEAPDVAAGDEVVFYGQGGPSAHEVAVAAGTSIYELLCRIGARVPRFYTRN